MRVTSGTTRAGMSEEAACDWQAFTREDRVGGVGVAQVMEPDIVRQASAASNAVPETVD